MRNGPVKSKLTNYLGLVMTSFMTVLTIAMIVVYLHASFWIPLHFRTTMTLEAIQTFQLQNVCSD
jgi:hypothetical protein